MPSLIPEINYEHPLRFQLPTKHEYFMEVFDEILIRTENSSYFAVGFFNKIKKNEDDRIIKLRELQEADIFLFELPKQQYERIVQLLKEEKFINDSNVNVTDLNTTINVFLKAILDFDTFTILNIKAEVIKYCGEKIKSNPKKAKKEFYKIAKKYEDQKWVKEINAKSVRRCDLNYQKIQALFAAKLLLELISTQYDDLQYNYKPNMSELDARLFLTSKADSIWKNCTLVKNVIKTNEIIDFKIEFRDFYGNDCAMEVKIIISKTGKVEYVDRLASYVPLVHEYHISSHLPSDEIIRYRDALSTFTSGNIASTSFGLLPKPLAKEILLRTKPNDLSVESACKEIMWNQQRLKETREYFAPEGKGSLVKLEFDNADFKNLTK